MYETTYTDVFDTYANYEEFEDPIIGLEWQISQDPESFGLLFPNAVIRVAVSESVERINGMKIPIVRIFFRIEPDGTPVLMDLHFEWPGEEEDC